MNRCAVKSKHSINLKLGKWIEANATGWGVFALIAIVGMLVLGGVIRLWGS
jgi:hypothetical protein